MHRRLRTLAGLLAIALLAAFAPFAMAQNATTGSLSGTIADNSGASLPGASVVAVHSPTGTRYETTTGPTGNYSLLNLRVGGPYFVTASLSGFKEWARKDVSVRLGEDSVVNASLELGTVSEEITVTAEVGLINPTSTGPTSNVAQQQIQSLPTISRGIEDFGRLNPYFDAKGSGDGRDRPVLSVAGRNNRYNNIQIDGSVNNDLFAISDASAPGNAAEGQPISLDAIQEVQLLVAPYDVRQGGFTGGGLNAITKSGANTPYGTAYYFFRNNGLTGDGPNERPLGKFDAKQFGASLGGPIQKDRAFFFVNVDWGRQEQPSGFSIDGASGQPFGHQAEADQFLSILQNRYGYSPGDNPKAEFTRNITSDKVFGRLDFNLAKNHQLTVRHNYIKGQTDVGSVLSSRLYIFPDNWYQPHEKVHSSVVQLNSTFGTTVNELRIGYQRLRTVSDGPTRFPQVLVDLTDGTQLRAGRENFRTQNALDQDIIELTDDLTLHRGNHTFTLGTHNEFFKFRNLFIRDNFGTYRFSSLANFDAGLAQQYDRSFSLTGDPQEAARFKVQQLGFYAGDTWRMKPDFTLTYGARVDVPIFPDKPTANPAAQAIFGFATDVAPSPTLFSPRAGFNWSPGGEARQQLRGGVGIFSGRTPYVWLSNQYGNTGIEFQRIGASNNAANRIPFFPDPDGQPNVVAGATAGTFRNEVDVVDPDYKFPSVLRSNIGYDRELGFLGLTGTVEFLYTKTIKDIAYKNLNRVAGSARRQDGRPVFVVVNPNFSDVILLANTSKGYQWTALAKVERPYRNGVYASASWLYGRSRSLTDGTSSQAASNWGNLYNPGDPNNPPVAISNFDPGHRINLALTYDLKISKINTTIGLFYNGQSGRPYTFTVNGDVNADARFTNDLLFVPSAAGDVNIINGTWEQLDAYINADPLLSSSRGSIVKRNGGRAKWANALDARLAFKIPTAGKVNLELTADVTNVLNLLNKDWGVFDLGSFNDLNPFVVTTDSAGRYTYNLATINSPTYVKFDRDDLRSRWQAQLGARVRF